MLYWPVCITSERTRVVRRCPALQRDGCGGRVSSRAAIGRSPIISSVGQRPTLAASQACRAKPYHQYLGAMPREGDARPSALAIFFARFIGRCPMLLMVGRCPTLFLSPLLGLPQSFRFNSLIIMMLRYSIPRTCQKMKVWGIVPLGEVSPSIVVSRKLFGKLVTIHYGG